MKGEEEVHLYRDFNGVLVMMMPALTHSSIIILPAVYAKSIQECWCWTQACEEGKGVKGHTSSCIVYLTRLYPFSVPAAAADMWNKGKVSTGPQHLHTALSHAGVQASNSNFFAASSSFKSCSLHSQKVLQEQWL